MPPVAIALRSEPIDVQMIDHRSLPHSAGSSSLASRAPVRFGVSNADDLSPRIEHAAHGRERHLSTKSGGQPSYSADAMIGTHPHRARPRLTNPRPTICGRRQGNKPSAPPMLARDFRAWQVRGPDSMVDTANSPKADWDMRTRRHANSHRSANMRRRPKCERDRRMPAPIPWIPSAMGGNHSPSQRLTPESGGLGSH
jgi:hypothetical protein